MGGRERIASYNEGERENNSLKRERTNFLFPSNTDPDGVLSFLSNPRICDIILSTATLEPFAGCCIRELESSFLSYFYILM